MAKMMTLQAAYNGGMDMFYKHCIRYGTVKCYHDYIDHTGKECRDVSVIIQGCNAVITKRLGEIIGVQYESNN